VSELDKAGREVLETVLEMASAFDRKDLDALIGAHYQGPESSMIPAGVTSRSSGWEAVRDRLETLLGEFQQSKTTIDKAEVSLFGDVAIIDYEQRIQSRVHDIEFAWEGWVTDVFLHREGRWLRVHHHASDRRHP
jgi:ketosteroid isomerase-like protein